MKIKKLIRKRNIAALLALSAASASVFAGYSLPAPVSTVTDGNYIVMLSQGFSELATLLIGVFGILSMVVMAALFAWEFVQVNNGKKTWGSLIFTMVVGGLVLVIVYILLSIADGNNSSGFTYNAPMAIEHVTAVA